jgi:hypothetical protein
MPFTTDDLSRLQRALASGTRSVKFKDREILYSGMDDLKAAIIEVKADLAAQAAVAAGTPSPRITRLYTRSGFDSNSGSSGPGFT